MKKLILLLFIPFVFTCSSDSSNDDTNPDQQFFIENAVVNGFAQKGPFLNGSSILLSELDENFNQTGLNYNTQIIDNSGIFQLNGISLVSEYATLRADGFYYNEVCGIQSNSQITLNAISNISDISNINLNVLTHLEKSRVEYLILNNSNTFEEAKLQAQSEILSIFNIDETINPSENLDVSGNTDGDAILIAISSILQGFRSEAQFSEIMANIITDIRTDGELNSNSLGSQLISHAVYLDAEDISNNIQERYDELGVSVNVPQFTSYISNFIDNSEYEIIDINVFEYPEGGQWGMNLLDPNINESTMSGPSSCDDIIDNDVEWYSLKAIKNNECTDLKVKLTLLSENDLCNEDENGYCWPWYFVDINSQISYVPVPDESSGWTTLSTLDLAGNLPLSNELILNSDSADIGIYVDPGTNFLYDDTGIAIGYEPVRILVEYFENNMSTATSSKELLFECFSNTPIDAAILYGLESPELYWASSGEGQFFSNSLGVEEIAMTIYNNGVTEISNFDVSYKVINETGGSSSEIVETINTTIAPFQSLTYTFNEQYDFSQLGEYQIITEILLQNDGNMENNQLGYAFTNVNPEIGIIGIDSPFDGVLNNEEIRFTVQNFGNVPVSLFDAYYSVNSSDSVFQTFGDTSNSILPGESLTFVFIDQFDFSEPGEYEVTVVVQLENDMDSSNNLYTINVTSE